MAPTPFFLKGMEHYPYQGNSIIDYPMFDGTQGFLMFDGFFPCNQLPSQQSSSVVDWLGGSAESIERPWPCLSRFAGLLVMSAMPSLLAESQKN
jgi:hypothetical protein